MISWITPSPICEHVEGQGAEARRPGFPDVAGDRRYPVGTRHQAAEVAEPGGAEAALHPAGDHACRVRRRCRARAASRSVRPLGAARPARARRRVRWLPRSVPAARAAARPDRRRASHSGRRSGCRFRAASPARAARRCSPTRRSARAGRRSPSPTSRARRRGSAPPAASAGRNCIATRKARPMVSRAATVASGCRRGRRRRLVEQAVGIRLQPGDVRRRLRRGRGSALPSRTSARCGCWSRKSRQALVAMPYSHARSDERP